MTQSNFECRYCGTKMFFMSDGKTFYCDNCGWKWELTKEGQKLLRSIELE